MPHRPRRLSPRHSLPGQRIANSRWLFALLWSGSGCPRPPRNLCLSLRTSLPHRRHHCPSQPPPWVHRRPPQRPENLPRLRHDSTVLLRRIIPFPTPRRQRRRRASLPRGQRRLGPNQPPHLYSLHSHSRRLFLRGGGGIRRHLCLRPHRNQ